VKWAGLKTSPSRIIMIIFDKIKKKDIERVRREWKAVSIIALIFLFTPLIALDIVLWILFTLMWFWNELCYLFYGEL
jgi:hypothetical protein